ncbi:MAG: GspE/PulE family protein [Chlamydiota bacterium]|nr:GspE/PulE family protein [Chlamydiota bacterium]
MSINELLRIFPREYLFERKILPVEEPDGRVKLLICPDTDPWSLHNISVTLEQPFFTHKISSTDLLKELRLMMEKNYATPGEVIEKDMQGRGDASVATEKMHQDLLEYGQDNGAVKFVNSVLMEALRFGATDVHFQPVDNASMVVRYRIDGILRDTHRIDGPLVKSVCARVKVISKMDLTQKRIPQDGRTSVTNADKKVEIRVSSLPTSNGERLVLRLLDKDNLFFPSPQLGLEPDQHQCMKRMMERSSGMILVTGPTGCGKTTTLYSFISEMNLHERNVMTIEDPVEYHLPDISQMQVQPKIGLDFAQGLRAILRQDPDVILVGEIRDQQTARIAIRAALTGHLVLSTLHTNDAVGALTRLMDLDVEPYLINDALIGVLSQRLLRKTCSSCKVQKTVPAEMFHRSEMLVSIGAGCSECFGSGYRGRTGVYEILSLESEKLKMLLSTKAKENNIRDAVSQEGFIPLTQVGLKKIEDGVTDVQELTRVLG